MRERVICGEATKTTCERKKIAMKGKNDPISREEFEYLLDQISLLRIETAEVRSAVNRALPSSRENKSLLQIFGERHEKQEAERAARRKKLGPRRGR